MNWIEKELQIKQAEKILGYKFHDWQKEYIRKGESAQAPKGRRTGRTTAHMMHQLLRDKSPLIVRTSKLCTIVDESHGREYARWYLHELIDLRERLTEGGMKIREIKVIQDGWGWGCGGRI